MCANQVVEMIYVQMELPLHVMSVVVKVNLLVQKLHAVSVDVAKTQILTKKNVL